VDGPHGRFVPDEVVEISDKGPVRAPDFRSNWNGLRRAYFLVQGVMPAEATGVAHAVCGARKCWRFYAQTARRTVIGMGWESLSASHYWERELGRLGTSEADRAAASEPYVT